MGLGLKGSLATHRLLQGQCCLGLPCLPERFCSVDAEIIAASGLPASAKLLQHSPGLWWFLVPKLCVGSTEQAARFGRPSVVSLVKSFLWLCLLGLRKYSFYSPLLFLPDANKLFNICSKCCFSKEREMFGEFCFCVSLRSLRFGWGEGWVPCVNVAGVYFSRILIFLEQLGTS